ncbi:MAG TPA: hypothetical protein VFQ61_26655 [Polyangiaceae bacterium]|nr:hypothetical protein [Polyangiaceae bacterium]
MRELRNLVLAGCVLALGGFAPACSNDDDSPTPASTSGRGGTSSAGTDRGGSAGQTDSSEGGQGERGGQSGTSEGGTANSASGGAEGNQGGEDNHAGATNSGGAAGGPSTAPPVSIFYLDASRDRVMWLPPRARQPKILVSNAGKGPDGIAVDTTIGALFWTTMGVPADEDGAVSRANLDGSESTSIIATGDTFTPKQIQVDASGGKLYWADREGMRIQRADLDGSALETLVTVASGAAARSDASHFCVGIAIDPEGGYLYWTQKGDATASNGSIRRAHLEIPQGQTDIDRTDVEILFEGVSEPIDLAIDPVAGYLYWTSRGDNTVNRAGLEVPDGETAATRRDREVLVPNVEEPIGISLGPTGENLYFTNLAGTIGRYDLNTGTYEDVLTGGGALTGLSVVAPF